MAYAKKTRKKKAMTITINLMTGRPVAKKSTRKRKTTYRRKKY